MNKLSTEDRARVITALVEGNSINATCRMTGVAKMTVLKLLRDVGSACSRFHYENVRCLHSERIQCDEVWSFCYSKDKNLPPQHRGHYGYGSVWTWTALDADSKLLVAWHVGGRTLGDARAFARDLATRIPGRVQITTDGHPAYLSAIIENFPDRGTDYGVLLKYYGPSGNDGKPETRYSPGRLLGVEKRRVLGNARDQHISTSFVERSNLTIRMGNRRFTRLTNGFSKKFENHCHALAIQFVHYNFCRMHKTLRCSPAMAAGIAKTLWSVEDLVLLADRPATAVA